MNDRHLIELGQNIEAMIVRANEAGLLSNISLQPEVSDDPEVVGVTDDTKTAQPAAAVTDDQKQSQLVNAVRRATQQGEHQLLTELLEGFVGVVNGASGLIKFIA